MPYSGSMHFESGSWLEAIYDVIVGIVVGAAHSWYFVDKYFREHIVQPVQTFFGLEVPIDRFVLPEKDKTLKVIGVGYGRTGTYSLKLALDELGFPALHTQHLYEHDNIFQMWLENVFQPSIDAKTASLRTPDLDVITDQGFQATCDLPMALYYEQIMKQYPDSKFILTTRKNSDEWFRSWDTMTRSITQPASFGNIVPQVRPYMIYLRWLFAMVNKDDSYLVKDYPLPDQDRASSIESYEEHNRKVREVIPQDRLLEYSVKDGWDPLCKFLEIDDCPTTPFPKTNSARYVQVQAISSFIVPFSICFFVACLVFVQVFRRLTGTTVIGWCQWKVKEIQCRLRRVVIGGEKMNCS